MGVPFCAFFNYLFSNKRLTHTIYRALYNQSEVYVTIKIVIAILFCDFEEGGILCQRMS